MDATQKKQLRADAHALKPIIYIGQAGLTQPVLNEIELALNCHELIKVKVRAERDVRKAMLVQICIETGAELVQTIGHIAVIYRQKPRKTVSQIKKPNTNRYRVEKRTEHKRFKHQ